MVLFLIQVSVSGYFGVICGSSECVCGGRVYYGITCDFNLWGVLWHYL